MLNYLRTTNAMTKILLIEVRRRRSMGIGRMLVHSLLMGGIRKVD